MLTKVLKQLLVGVMAVCIVVSSSGVNVLAARQSNTYTDFIRGGDVSMLKSIEDLGGTFYDNGVQQDALKILNNHGANYVRLRLWVNPYDEAGNSYGGGGNDFQTTLTMALRAKQLGMKVLLDFHLSDYWADPGTQSKPKAWQNLSYAQLKTSLNNYMKTTMDAFKAAGVVPEMVQIGNETSSGILWDDGLVGGTVTDFSKLAELVSVAIKGVRDSVGNQSKIVLHLDNGGNNSLYRWWFDGITNCGYVIDYDIIGLTYYPMWHGTMEDLQYNLNDISNRYDKDVMIVETAYAFTTEDGDGLGSSFSPEDAIIGGYPATVQGQMDFMTDLETVLLNVPNKRGLGFFYWEPTWIPTEGAHWGTEAGKAYIGDDGILSNPWDNLALFDFDGNALDSIDMFNVPEENKIINSSFETNGITNAPSGWNVWLKNGTTAETVKTESGGMDGSYKLTFWNDSSYECSIYQIITGLEDGIYSLSAWVMSNAGQNTCQIYAKNYGGEEKIGALPLSDIGWNKVEIDNIVVSNGQCEIGLYAVANTNDWCNIDQMIFRKK